MTPASKPMTEANCDKRHASNWRVISFLAMFILAIAGTAGAAFQQASSANARSGRNEVRLDGLEKQLVEKLDDILDAVRTPE